MHKRYQFVALLSVLSLLIACLPAQAAENSTASQAIQAAYDKVCVAVSLKFPLGVVSSRAWNFEAFNPDGKRQDLAYEQTKWQQMFGQALTAKETVQILNFHQVDATHVTCQVHQTIEFEMLDNATHKPTTIILDCRSEDDWQSTPQGWRQKACHLHEQTLKRK